MQTIELKHPFTFEGGEVTELNIRRPKMRDVKKGEKIKGDLEKVMAMICDLAEVSPKLVAELDVEDFGIVSDIVGEFMGVSPD